MSRADIRYGDSAATARQFEGFDPDTPVAGFYGMRMRSGGVLVAIRIWHGAPLDPVTGEEMDRSHRWQATANGEPIDLERVWPKCAADRIDEAEAYHLASLQQWGAANGHAALADPRKRIDHLSTPLMF